MPAIRRASSTCAALMFTAAAAGQVGTVRVLALEGVVYPGVPGPLWNLSWEPSVGFGGRVAFGAYVIGPGGQPRAFFIVDASAASPVPKLALLEGEPAPGAPGATLFNFNQPAIVMGDGRVVVKADIDLPALPFSPDMVYIVDGTTVTPLYGFQEALPGMVTPGAHVNPNEVAATPAGVVFSGPINVYPQGASSSNGLWMGNPGDIDLVALRGQTVPVPVQPLFWSTSFDHLTINPTGRIAFHPQTTSIPNGTPRQKPIVFTGVPGDLRAVAWLHRSVPGVPGATFSSFGDSTVNTDGAVCFSATIRTGAGETLGSIWIDRDGAMSLIAKEGDPAPGTSAIFKVVAGTSAAAFLAADNEWIAFRGVLTGPGVTPQNEDGLWAGRPGSFHLIGRALDQAPGLAPGVLFLSDPSEYSINGRGQMVFRARLTGAGVSLEDDAALFYADPFGRVAPIVREGDQVLIAPGDQRIITVVRVMYQYWGTSGRPRFLSDDGYVAFGADLSGALMNTGILAAKLPDPCYADCTLDGTLSVADFGCFQTYYGVAHPSADCNGDGALTVADFGCFQTSYIVGCP